MPALLVRLALPIMLLLAISAAPAHSAPTVTNFTADATSSSQPTAITSGPLGALWAVGTGDPGRALKITTAGAITEFLGGVSNGFPKDGQPSAITVGPDGNLWIAEYKRDKLVRLTPSGVATEFGSVAKGKPRGITAGPDGRVWYTEEGSGGAIGRMNTDGSNVVSFSSGLTTNSLPTAIVTGPDGNLWFTEQAADKIGRITPAGVITEFSTGITPGRAPGDIAAGPDGALWFTETGLTGGIGRITTDGVVTEFFTGLSPSGKPQGIAAGADGALWFTKSASPAAVGRITVDGTITEHLAGIASNAQPLGITAGPDGAMWLADSAGTRGNIGRVTVPPAAGEAKAASLSGTTAAVAATVTPNGSLTTYRFEYTPSEGAVSATPDFGAGNGATAVAVAADLTGLTPDTEYKVRVVGVSDAGVTPGPLTTFTTSSPPPTPDPTPLPDPDPTPLPDPDPTPLPDPVPTPRPDPVPTATEPAPAREAESPPETSTQPSPHAVAASTPRPVLRRSVVVAAEQGVVRYRAPGAAAYIELTSTTTLPLGATIDATKGTVLLDSALPGRKRQQARFSHGVFSASQPSGRKGLVRIRLRGGRFASCRGATASVSRKAGGKRKKSRKRGARVIRRLWGSDRHGRFQTHGRDSVATVRGTRWLTEDRCDGTRTTVTSGAVDVRRRGSKRTHRVRAGQSYLARARR